MSPRADVKAARHAAFVKAFYNAAIELRQRAGIDSRYRVVGSVIPGGVAWDQYAAIQEGDVLYIRMAPEQRAVRADREFRSA